MLDIGIINGGPSNGIRIMAIYTAEGNWVSVEQDDILFDPNTTDTNTFGDDFIR